VYELSEMPETGAPAGHGFPRHERLWQDTAIPAEAPVAVAAGISALAAPQSNVIATSRLGAGPGNGPGLGVDRVLTTPAAVVTR
jgi:hypothetical protein